MEKTENKENRFSMIIQTASAVLLNSIIKDENN